jgi:hypothetical protein
MPTLEQIGAARERISHRLHVTPVTTARLLGAKAGLELFLKCENLQKTGSFKTRGALSKLSALGQEALRRGAHDYLRKPFSFVVLVARLHALARRGSAPRPRLLSCGALTLDPASGDCTVAGETVTLQPRERDVLEVLLRSHPRVMSKDRLLDAVWGIDAPSDGNLVEVYVSSLRRKIGAERIQTVRGLGYRLVDPDA